MKKITQLLLGLIVLGIPFAAWADDRTPVSEVYATITYSEPFSCGNSVIYPNVSVDERSVVNITSSLLLKYSSSGEYIYYDEPIFTEGKYAYKVRVEIKSEYADSYCFADGWRFIVDGTDWETAELYGDHTTFGFAYLYFELFNEPVTEVVATSNYRDVIGFKKYVTTPTFTLADDSNARIPQENILWQKYNEALSSEWSEYKWEDYKASEHLTFDPGTYRLLVRVVTDLPAELMDSWTFTVNGEEWLTSSVDFVHTTADGYYYALAYSPEIEVTEPTRIPVTDVVATSNYRDIIGYGKPVIEPIITTADGSIAHVSSSNIRWKKMTAPDWFENYNASEHSTFEEGTYRLQVRVDIDGDNGLVYTFADPWNFSVNGEDWLTGTPFPYSDYSFAWASSPEIMVDKSGVDNVSADTTDAPTNVYNLQGIVVKRDATDLSGLPAGLYIIGGKKVLVK